MVGAVVRGADVLQMAEGLGGLGVNHTGRLKELEKENARLKRLVSEQVLDIAILREVSRGNR